MPIITKFKEDKNFKFTHPIFTYEILGKTPLDANLNKSTRWLKFKGYLNYNSKSDTWSISIRNLNSLDYYVSKYRSKDLKETLLRLYAHKFKDLEYIRNVEIDDILILKLLKEDK